MLNLKDTLSKYNLRDIVERLGISMTKGFKINCPECGSGSGKNRTAACHVYSDHYHCFACQSHGDAINLVQLSLRLSFPDAYKWITGETIPNGNENNAEKNNSISPNEMIFDVPVGTQYRFYPKSNKLVEIPYCVKVKGIKNAIKFFRNLLEKQLQEESLMLLDRAIRKGVDPIALSRIHKKFFPVPLYPRERNIGKSNYLLMHGIRKGGKYEKRICCL